MHGAVTLRCDALVGVDQRDTDLGTRLGTPLGENMTHAELFEADALPHFDITAQTVEVE